MKKGMKDSYWDKKLEENISEEVLARLTGEDEEQFRERQINKLKDVMIARYNSRLGEKTFKMFPDTIRSTVAHRTRDNVFYQRWDWLADQITVGTKREIMEAVFSLIEDCKGHHRNWIADSSQRQLKQVLIERGWNN